MSFTLFDATAYVQEDTNSDTFHSSKHHTVDPCASINTRAAGFTNVTTLCSANLLIADPRKCSAAAPSSDLNEDESPIIQQHKIFKLTIIRSLLLPISGSFYSQSSARLGRNFNMSLRPTTHCIYTVNGTKSSLSSQVESLFLAAIFVLFLPDGSCWRIWHQRCFPLSLSDEVTSVDSNTRLSRDWNASDSSCVKNSPGNMKPVSKVCLINKLNFQCYYNWES